MPQTPQESTSSKLIGKLREISRGTISPIGFTRVQAKKLASLLLLVEVPANDPRCARVAVESGADALICHLFNPAEPEERGKKGKLAEKKVEDKNGKAIGAEATSPAATDPAAEATIVEGEPAAQDANKASVEPAVAETNTPEGSKEVTAEPLADNGKAAGARDEKAPAKPKYSYGDLVAEREKLGEIVRIAGDRPVGVIVNSGGRLTEGDYKDLISLGVDFVVIHPHRSPVSLLSLEAIGHIARLDREYPSGPLRGLNELGLDAAYISVGRPEGSIEEMSVHDLANFRQLLEPIRRPAILVIGKEQGAATLRYFHEIGIESISIPAEWGEKDGKGEKGEEPVAETESPREPDEQSSQEIGEEELDRLRELIAQYRAAIEKLPPPVGRGRSHEGRRVILAPAISAAPSRKSDDDDDHDDDDGDDDGDDDDD